MVRVYVQKPRLKLPFKNSISDNDVLGFSWMTSLRLVSTLPLVQKEQRIVLLMKTALRYIFCGNHVV
jgi:hypothetical protein